MGPKLTDKVLRGLAGLMDLWAAHLEGVGDENPEFSAAIRSDVSAAKAWVDSERRKRAAKRDARKVSA